MDYTHYTDMCVQAAADLVNTKGHPSGNEYMGTRDLVNEFMKQHGFGPPYDATAADLKELQDVRDRLDRVFYAPDATEAARLVNELLADYDVKPYLTDHDGKWHFHYAPEGASAARRVASTTVMGLATVISDYGFHRLGTCKADDCGDVFVDMSRNRSRRYCNDLCSTRTNVAAYRAREKAKTS